jgi:hypothetical protein
MANVYWGCCLIFMVFFALVPRSGDWILFG